MRFELFIAARYLRAKRRQAVVGVITAISVVGVAVGVASLIIALAITNGMRRDLQDRLLSSTAHVELMRIQADGIRNWRPLTERLRHLPHVTAAAPGLYEQVLVSRGAQSNGAILKGILPSEERTVSDLLSQITEGSAAALNEEPATQATALPATTTPPSSRAEQSEAEGPNSTPSSRAERSAAEGPASASGEQSESQPATNGSGDAKQLPVRPAPNGSGNAKQPPVRPAPEGPASPSTDLSDSRPATNGSGDAKPFAVREAPIVIGSDLANTLNVKLGDSVLTVSPQGEMTPVGLIPKYQRFQVTGIFHSGFYQYDSSWGFIRLSDAQKLFGEPDVISVISFKVDNLYHADQIAREIEQAAGPGFMTNNWMQQNRELFRALRLEQIVTVIVIGLIVCVAALNILIALTMMVMEKTRDIAVLMSYGVHSAQVRRIFQLQGLLISVLGTALGLLLGYTLSFAGAHYRIHLSSDVYSIDYLPFAPRALDGLIVALASLGVSLLATLYPSQSAAKVLPAEALRYE
jgi:ABC-type lipoprotein release transport system permease subunit